MKNFITVVVICFITINTFSQTEKLLLFEKSKKDKIQVGMSISEIKTIFKNPKAIESGFPTGDTQIVKELPKHRGQNDYTTWFYYYPLISIIYEEPSSAIYKINDKVVTKIVFDCYLTSDSVYTMNGIIIASGSGESYKELKNPKLKKEPKISMLSTPNIVSERNCIPILCVIFEKGTQSVADSKMYFQLQ